MMRYRDLPVRDQVILFLIMGGGIFFLFRVEREGAMHDFSEFVGCPPEEVYISASYEDELYVAGCGVECEYSILFGWSSRVECYDE